MSDEPRPTSRRRIPLKVNPAPTRDDLASLVLVLQDGLNKALARIEELTDPGTFILERSRNVHPALKVGLRELQAAAHADDTDHRAHHDFLLAMLVCGWATGCEPGDIIDKWLNPRCAGDDLADWLKENQ